MSAIQQMPAALSIPMNTRRYNWGYHSDVLCPMYTKPGLGTIPVEPLMRFMPISPAVRMNRMKSPAGIIPGSPMTMWMDATEVAGKVVEVHDGHAWLEVDGDAKAIPTRAPVERRL